MDEIDTLTLAGLAAGKTPLEVAMSRIEVLLSVRGTIVEGRAHDPGAFALPAWERIDDPSMAGRIVANLLDAGWSPPNPSTISQGLRLAADRMEVVTDAELIATYDDSTEAPVGHLARVRAGLTESAQDYRRRADELDAAAETEFG